MLQIPRLYVVDDQNAQESSNILFLPWQLELAAVSDILY